MNRDRFQFLKSYLDSLEGFDDETAGKCLLALAKYAISGTEPDLTDPVIRMYFTLIKPIIDLSGARAEAGRKGGSKSSGEEPDGDDDPDKEKKEVTDSKANQKQSASKPQAKRKQSASKAEAIKDIRKRNKDRDIGFIFSAPARAKKNKSDTFKPPSVVEFQDYARSSGHQIDAATLVRIFTSFFRYNASKDWMIGSTPVSDWRPLADTWLDKAQDSVTPKDEFSRLDCESLEKQLDQQFARDDFFEKVAGG